MEKDIKKEQHREESSSAKAMEDKLKELENKAEEYLNNWKRSAADLINYKKDEIERMAKLLQYSKEDMILEILPVLDNIYLAEKNIPATAVGGIPSEGEKNIEQWIEGFKMIKKQLEDFIKQQGIEEIKIEGEKFNPETM